MFGHVTFLLELFKNGVDMKKITKKVTVFRCEKCKTDYETAREAIKCEGYPTENRVFKKGDWVKGKEQLTCDYEAKDRGFLPIGKVVKVVGPEPMDYEYSVKWLRGELLNSHVFVYEVVYKCICGQERRHIFYSPELSLLNPR